MRYRVCRSCGERKRYDEFPASSTGPPTYCLECGREHSRRLREQLKRVPKTPPEWKLCPKCERYLPSKRFPRQEKEVTGLFWYCRDCWSRMRREEYRAEQPRVAEKTCSRCKETKPASAFHGLRRSATGLRPECAECHVNEMRRRRCRDTA